MTVYVTGDIHSGLDMQKLRDWELGDGLTSDDYLIVAGDFGFPWNFSAEECADIAWLESRPYTVLFVDGNHERFDHWEERPMEPWHGGLTQRLSDTSSIRRLTRGEVFELDGSTIFTMGGATSVDREYRVPYSSWWPQELPDERDFDTARARLGELAAEFIHLGHEQCVLGPEVGSLAQQLLPPCRLDPLGSLIEDGLHAGCLADFLFARIVCHGAALQSTTAWLRHAIWLGTMHGRC